MIIGECECCGENKELEELEVENDYFGQCIISSLFVCSKCEIDCREDRSIVNELLGNLA